jgi:rare lipoprotein A
MVLLAPALVLVDCAHVSESGPVSAPAAPLSIGSIGASFEGTRAPADARDEVQVGYATWYGAAFAGRKTASGERFDPHQLTAAHRTLPFGTWVEVRRVDTGDAVRVRITDRGPFGHEDRIIDLSRAAAERIGLLKAGVARVELRVVEGP